jgi:[ribosomal protein S5]-alanine N-acetyltransferase
MNTHRLTLRALHQADVPLLYRFSLDPEFRRYEEGPPVTEEQFFHILRGILDEQMLEPRPSYYFGIVRQADDQFMGSCYIAPEISEHRQAEIGYMLGTPFWGQGYTTEAVRQVIAFGFTTLKMHRIFAEVISENQGSVRVLEKLGMRREGLLRDHRWFQNRWWDTAIYALRQPEWEVAQHG